MSIVAFNHFIGTVSSPLSVSLLLAVGSFVFFVCGRRRIAYWGIVSSVLLLWMFSCNWMLFLLSWTLSSEYPPQPLDKIPTADAIVVLGGGIGKYTRNNPYPELFVSSDRAWHAARLYKEGKAPVIVASGTNEHRGTGIFLFDLGVPEKAIAFDKTSRNTEENAKETMALLNMCFPEKDRFRILLVTSAWHMKRSMLMFQKYASGIEVIPAAADYEAIRHIKGKINWGDFVPGAEPLMRNTYLFKEIVGNVGYRLFRR